MTHACRFVARDQDGDGHPAAKCSATGITIQVGDDCDDTNPLTFPGAWDGPAGDGHSGACNGVDNDCNGKVDDGALANGEVCHCTLGATRSCAADGKRGTCAGGVEVCGSNGAWGACSVQPAAKDSCVPGNDDSCDGTPNEGCPCVGKDTPADYMSSCGSCGGKIQCDETCSIATPSNFGAACGSCGGTVQCDGSCSVATPSNFGAACGSCGGHVQCDGSCSVATPANFGAACGSCGGHIQCNGSCSVATPGNYGAACGSCGGTVQCNGACSVGTPGNLGQACNSCGGTWQCNGSCSTSQPGNLGQACNSCGGTVQCDGSCSTYQPGNLNAPCGSCGGHVQCDGSCSVGTPGDYGNVINRSADQERFACCYIDYYKTFGGPCDAGYTFYDAFVDKVSGGGACDIVSEGSGSDCTVRVHFHNVGLEGAVCNVTVREIRGCN
jgi:hypothetical protein